MSLNAAKPRADALVIFGVTGDLASRKIFPALQAMAKKGRLNLPVIGVARGDRDLDFLKATIKRSLAEHGGGGLDQGAFACITEKLAFVRGDYEDEATYRELHKALNGAKVPILYLAIPPSIFATVAEGMCKGKCQKGARIIVEKPFGRDLASAEALNATLDRYFGEADIYRIDHYLGKEAVQNLIYFHLANRVISESLDSRIVDHVQVNMAETLGVEGRGKFYEEVGALRDVVQNHMLQLVACLAMDCPPNGSDEALRREKSRVLQALRPLTLDDLVRGQYRGYRQEPGVSPDSNIETFVAARFFIDNERWDSVPFYLRTGKRLPVSATEIVVSFKDPLWSRLMRDPSSRSPGYLRFRISPDVSIAQGTRVKRPGSAFQGQMTELVSAYIPPDEMLPYERLFEDAIAGETELFASKDMINAQWAVLDQVLAIDDAPFLYNPGTWGPKEANHLLKAGVTWINPVAAKSATSAKIQSDPPARNLSVPKPAESEADLCALSSRPPQLI